MNARTSLLLILACTWVAIAAGCNRQPERVALSGVVHFDGTPIEDGQIAFEPLGNGKMEFGIITDGKYSIPEQFGLVPGEYLVRITGNQATGRKAEPDSFVDEQEGRSLEIFEQFIPPQFNSASNLKVQVEPVEHMQKDFTIASE